LSGRGLCDELITRPEESYRLCCVVVCDLETSRIGAAYIYIYDISSLRVNTVTIRRGQLTHSVFVCRDTNGKPQLFRETAPTGVCLGDCAFSVR